MCRFKSRENSSVEGGWGVLPHDIILRLLQPRYGLSARELRCVNEHWKTTAELNVTKLSLQSGRLLKDHLTPLTAMIRVEQSFLGLQQLHCCYTAGNESWMRHIGSCTCQRLNRITLAGDMRSESFYKLPRMSSLHKLTIVTFSDLSATQLKGLSTLTSLTTLNLTGDTFDDDTIAFIQHLTGLTVRLSRCLWPLKIKSVTVVQALDLSQTRVSNFSCVSGLRKLTSLSLWETSVGHKGKKALEGLTQLEHLDLENTKTTDGVVKRLANLKRLKHLNLAECTITDSGLSHLSSLTQLQKLNVNGNTVGDSGIKHLATLISLKSLSLSLTAVSDNGMGFVAGLTQLSALHLHNTRITQNTLRKLTHLKQLEELDVRGNKIKRDSRPLSILRNLPYTLLTLLAEVYLPCGLGV